MNRAVCDTNILISGLLWKGAPRQVLIRVENGKTSLFTSRALLEELGRVLDYPKLRVILRKAGLSRQDILRWVVRYATIVMCKPLDKIVISADPSDDHVLACAFSASADAIISGDKHILHLRSFRGIPVITAALFLKKVNG